MAPEVKAAFDIAFHNISTFHAAQRSAKDLDVETMPGVRCRRVTRPIGARAAAQRVHAVLGCASAACAVLTLRARRAGAVGLYVPGGTAVLPSTALMLAVPAQIAGCGTGAAGGATRARCALARARARA